MSTPRRQRAIQQGIVALALVALLLLIGSYFMLGSLNWAAVRVDRDRVSNDALLRAKEALIAYAVSDPNRPGELPCPDVDNDGRSTPGVDYIGINCAALIGRLPWFTLGLPDVRDDAGERLWYALSDDFRARGAVPGALALNNDTAFRPGNTSLSVSGLQTASNLVAVVFAPGAPLMRQDAASLQDRSAAGSLNPANYLDFASGQSNSDGDRVFVSAPKGEAFNDRPLPIHSDDIMWLVERRAGREFSQKLREHYDGWKAATGSGFYPWAAPFGDPASMQAGQNNLEEGLLPLSPAQVVWTSASITGGTCAGVGTNEIQCTALVLLGLGGDVTGRVGNIATSFVDPPNGSEVTTSGLLLLGTPVSTWSINRGARRLDFSTDITFLGTGVVTVRVRAPQASTWISAPSWLISNNWYQVAYYAVAPAFSIAGVEIAGNQSCGVCITVANTAAPANKEALVVMTGRALPGQPARPPTAPPPLATVDQFLENANQTTADRIFESNLKSAAFNDLPVVVRP